MRLIRARIGTAIVDVETSMVLTIEVEEVSHATGTERTITTTGVTEIRIVMNGRSDLVTGTMTTEEIAIGPEIDMMTAVEGEEGTGTLLIMARTRRSLNEMNLTEHLLATVVQTVVTDQPATHTSPVALGLQTNLSRSCHSLCKTQLCNSNNSPHLGPTWQFRPLHPHVRHHLLPHLRWVFHTHSTYSRTYHNSSRCNSLISRVRR